jgi:hypothetical protein
LESLEYSKKLMDSGRQALMERVMPVGKLQISKLENCVT